MAPRTTDIDRHVGKRLRDRRRDLRIPQPEFAEMMGVSYQQVQKYETGRNRLSPGRLLQVAGLLGAEAAFFFEGAETPCAVAVEDGGELTRLSKQWQDQALFDMAAVLAEMPNPKARRAFIELCSAVAETSRV